MAAALAGALVISFGAYALGSRTDDEPTQPSTPAQPAGRPGDSAANRNLTVLAGKLGVTPAQLRDASRKLRRDRKREADAARAKVAADLGKALHISRAKVAAALVKPYSLRKLRAAYAQQLATRLGLDAAAVGAALADQRAGRIRAGLPALATKLGVAEADLKRAVDGLRPVFARRRRNEQIAALAGDLGVSERRLRRALKGLRGVFARERAATRDKLAADLARHLGIPKSRVDQALASPGDREGAGP